MAPASSSGWEDVSSELFVKMSRNALNRQEQPATPTPKCVPMRASAEKYNPNARLRPQRSPAVPEADLNTSNLAIAFPGFSECTDIKPLSPNPFVDAKPVNKAFQPRVRDENDVSINSQPRSSLANIGKKNTRFSNLYVPRRRNGPQPHMYMHSPGLMQETAAMSSAEEPKPMAINAQGSLTSMPNGSSQSTLKLPQGGNLTDLFSGIIRQPPPNIPQQTKPRSSRFAPASKVQTVAGSKAEEIPVPHDERQLLHSIDVLQNRVEELETEKKASQGRKRSDSAVAASDEDNSIHRKLTDEKKRESLKHSKWRNIDADISKGLESTCYALQDNQGLLERDLESAIKSIKDLERDLASADKSIKNLEQERNEFATQLADADAMIEQLQGERDQIDHRCAQAVTQLEEAWSNNEVLTGQKDSLDNENKSLKAQIAILTHASAVKADLSTEQSIHDASFGNMSADDSGPQDMDTLSKMYHQSKAQQQKTQPERIPVEQKEPTPANISDPDSSHDITYLSVTGDSSLCKVRKNLEQERKARQQRRQAQASAKPSTSRVEDQNALKDQTTSEHSRHVSESSFFKTRPKRHAIPQDQMTSAFILPDITMNVQPAAESTVQPRVASEAHLQQGTTREYTDLLDYEPVAAQQQTAEVSLQPQLPIISDEEMDITIQDDDLTVRPTQPAEVALAAVLESLNTELASQKGQMVKYQADLDRLDTSLHRRQRKQILSRMKALLDSTDVKAEQIYNLHDVIEGQKKSGQPVTQNQLDNTLQSLGLDLPWEGIESTNASRRRSTASSRSL
ncbi:MAG: hypothetical protein Q9218_000008 [Villophora microphyllina]